MHTVTYGLACIDCIMVIANGDTSGIENLADWEATSVRTQRQLETQ